MSSQNLSSRWIFVSDRPCFISRNEEGLLHGIHKPAWEFADGFGGYAWRGMHVPFKYGCCPPEEWLAEWILTERNATLRRCLMEVIGFEKMVRQLGGVKLDQWREYELRRLPSGIEEEFLYLLTMTCPSTGAFYCLRVPPWVTTCREAARWCNWIRRTRAERQQTQQTPARRMRPLDPAWSSRSI